MDVVLFNCGPKAYSWSLFRTLGAYKIAQAIRQEGYNCQVIDFINFMTEEELLKCTLNFVNEETEVLAISTTFLILPGKLLPRHVINVINYVTDMYPKLKLVFGGYESRSPIETAKLHKTSYACITEYGEDTFVELLNYYKNNGPQPVFELYFKNENTYRIYKGPRNPKYNIETDNHLFTEQDCILPNETLPIEISRGCIFKCKFCNHLLLGRGKLDYLRDMALIRDELINNYEKWGVTNYYLVCDTFNDTEYKMQLWHKMISALPFKINYTAYLRADLLDRYPDVPYILQETCLLTAFHGLESLSVKASTAIGKGWSGKKAKEYIPRLYHDIWKKEIYQTCSFIIGLPGDTKESWRDVTVWFEENDLHHLAPHVLGLEKSTLNKNQSEFERNYEEYGYTFPDANNTQLWQNDYWNFKDAKEFLHLDEGRIRRISAKFGSWYIMLLLQFGFDKTKFSKEDQKLIDNSQLAIMGNSILNTYINKLLTQ